MSQHILLDPGNAALVVVDYHEDLLAELRPAARGRLARRTEALVQLVRSLHIPVVISCGPAANTKNGLPDYLARANKEPTQTVRRSEYCWDDPSFVEQVKSCKRNRLIFAGLFTETSVSLAALSSLELGYDAYLVTDATAAESLQAHWVATWRMVQAGVVPLTWRQLLFELRRAGQALDNSPGRAPPDLMSS